MLFFAARELSSPFARRDRFLPLLASGEVAPFVTAEGGADAEASVFAAAFGDAAMGAGTRGGYGIGGAPGYAPYG